MVCRQHNQCMLQAYLVINKCEELSQCSIQLQQHLLALGIGSRLVSECVGQARHFGYRNMILFTVRGLESARHLYEVEGFHLSEETPGHAWGHDHIAQTWKLKL